MVGHAATAAGAAGHEIEIATAQNTLVVKDHALAAQSSEADPPLGGFSLGPFELNVPLGVSTGWGTISAGETVTTVLNNMGSTLLAPTNEIAVSMRSHARVDLTADPSALNNPAGPPPIGTIEASSKMSSSAYVMLFFASKKNNGGEKHTLEVMVTDTNTSDN